MTEARTRIKWVDVVMRIVAPVLVLALFAGIAIWLIKTKKSAQRRPPPAHAAVVDVMQVAATNRVLRIEAMGDVVPAREIALRAQVSGRIVEQSPRLVEGGRFVAGETMVVIEPDDFDAAVVQAEAALAQATLNVALEEQRHAVAAEEWQLSGQGATGAVAQSVALRDPHLQAARAARSAAESALEQARRNRERTMIRAPFDCVVLEKSSDVGHIATPQGVLARIAGTQRFYVRAAVPVGVLPRFEIPKTAGEKGARATVSLRGQGGVVTTRSGHVVQLLGDLSPAGRMARVLVAVDDPMSGNAVPLLLGAYVRCEIAGETVENVIVLPRAVVRDGDQAWVANAQNRLEVRTLDIVWQAQNAVYVAGGISPGDRVITTQLPSAIPGLALRLLEDNSTQGDDVRRATTATVGETP